LSRISVHLIQIILIELLLPNLVVRKKEVKAKWWGLKWKPIVWRNHDERRAAVNPGPTQLGGHVIMRCSYWQAVLLPVDAREQMGQSMTSEPFSGPHPTVGPITSSTAFRLKTTPPSLTSYSLPIKILSFR